MAIYVFESATDGSNFLGSDALLFTSATASMVKVLDHPEITDPLGNHPETITLTANDHSLTFAAADLSAASIVGRVGFQDGDALLVGTHGIDTIRLIDAGAGHGTVTYGLDGDDTIYGTSAANDTIFGGAGDDSIRGSSSHTDANGNFTENDVYQGGAGDDTIEGGDGNDHIYGNVAIGAAGLPDGNDIIDAGQGSDYVNGNAGNDVIDGEGGSDRLFGGSGNDAINGDAGNDSIQGNQGDDTVDGGTGNDTVRGGSGNDHVLGNADADLLWGDLGNDTVDGSEGNDTLHGGAGYDVLTGGTESDLFVFAVGDADTRDMSEAAGSPHRDRITDFEDHTDHLSLGFTVSAVIHGGSGVQFQSVSAAMAYAQTQLDGSDGTKVAAITYNHDTYLFWNDTHDGATINSVVQVVGRTDDIFNAGSQSDFV